MNSQGILILNFIKWVRDVHSVTLEEWCGPESDIVNDEDLTNYITDYLESTYEN